MFECYLWGNQPCRFCQTLQGFHRHETLGAKNREVPVKLEKLVTLKSISHVEVTLYVGQSELLDNFLH